ncbi:VOC family protein [Natronosalvus caseinilyticus]|uniref:VOC family protein n=1 Tax=Natronosalvus caseinilyticus TaxID=2953747 RepID=UPI0028ABCC93|nr:VOC family protein [Natronosalvus caseinilyticus]
MLTDTPGLHHVTTITGPPQPTLEFYLETLGLALRCRTVNFEDILAHHLYFGNPAATPGAILTCFPYGDVDPGRLGAPQPTAVAFAIPSGSVSSWRRRLESRGHEVKEETRFDERVLSITDPDGTPIELVERSSPVTESSPIEAWKDGPVPPSIGIRGLHSVTVTPVNPYATAATLETLGLERVGQEGDRIRYRADGTHARVIDILDRSTPYGREGPGTIHHVAIRAASVDELYEWHDLFRERGYDTSRVKDRHFYHSLYVREPGGILFELATESPGFDVADSSPNALYLPPRFEADRELIESQLPPVTIPGGDGGDEGESGADETNELRADEIDESRADETDDQVDRP